MLMPTMEDTDGHTMVATTATERGLLTPNPLPLLMPRPNHGTTAATDTDGPTMVTPITERGPLMLNLPPMLMPSLNHGITAATDMDGPIMVTLIMERGLLMPNLPPTLMPSLNHGGMAATEHMPGPTMVTTGVKLIGPKHCLNID